jgi:hypothetical protein
MACAAKRVRVRAALPLGCALAALWATPASAESDFKLISADTLELTGDVRIAALDGERSWVEGGYGKLRTSGGGSVVRVVPELGNVNLVWQPRFTWSLSAVVVGSFQGGDRTQAGLSQAYLNFRPMRSDKLAVSARAGLMWPPVSLEHEGPDWHVKDSITPSAINSWIGEEVRPVALEGTLSASLGRSKLRATAAVMAANDTSGTLLTFRGWALHDTTTLAFNRQPLPPLDPDIADYQAHFTHPLLDIPNGFARRPGYYAKFAWQLPIPVRLELFRYDNRADPQSFNSDMEWGWWTRFNNLGLVANLGPNTVLKAQAMQGTTVMGFRESDGRRWVDDRFRSAFAMLVQSFGKVGVAVRAEAFDTRNHGSDVGDEYDDTGWSAMIAGRREWGPVTGLVELLHVSSRRENREDLGLKPRQRQTQLQAEVRIHW